MKRFKPRFRPTRRAFLANTGALAVGLSFLPRHSLSQEEKRLNFYNWDTYIGETTLEDFQARPASRCRWTSMPTTTSCSPS
jgi:spermidine/putrescine transport system substrate-binding protein